MFAKTMGFILAALVVMTVSVPCFALQDEGKYTARLALALALALENPDHAVYPIWVKFADKGLTAAETALALDAFAAELPAEVKSRRGRRTSGTPIVDEADLPLDTEYLQAVTATGAHPRQQSRWLNAASFDATPEQIQAIAGLPFVTAIDRVGQGTGSKSEFMSEPPDEALAIMEAARDKSQSGLAYGASLPGLEQINVTGAHALGLSGEGVTVALLDTGFMLDHECLQEVDVVATWDFINGDGYVGPRHDEDPYQTYYGTASLSALVGFSPDNLIGSAYGASVILAKTEDLSDETPAEEDNWIAAVEWAEGLGADIISSGLGYYYWYEFADLDGSTALITVAAELAAARGVCVVNSVGDQRGNEDWNHIIPPSDGRSVLAVGSADLNNQITFSSSPGPTSDGRIKPDILALGSGVSVAYDELSDMYIYGYGTNFAVPLVSGVVALMLEQNPHLNPLQVQEALRETGSRAVLPDNDYGWGLIDAVAAMNYWAPTIEHTPMTDTEGGTGPHPVTATITASQGIDESRMWVAWRLAGQSWQMEPLVHDAGDVYTGLIPPQSPFGSDVEYYLVATDNSGLATLAPSLAPQDVYSFRVSVDTTPPNIEHTNIPDQVPATWPPTLIAFASDNLGLDHVEVMFHPNPGQVPGPFYMNKVGDHFELEFPLDPTFAIPGMTYTYMLVAKDLANTPNVTVNGPHSFTIVTSKGNVLVVDDRANSKNASSSERGGTLPPSDQDKSSADVADWIRDAGFTVDVLPAGEVDYAAFLPYDAVMISSGGNYGPLNHTEMRRAMVAWVEDGGRLLVEGGEVAYAADIAPGYPELMGAVLPINGYFGEDGGNLYVPSTMADHPLLHRPHWITGPLFIDNMGGQDYAGADLVDALPSAFVAMRAGYGTNRGGIVFHDNNTGPDAGQIVYLPFDLLKAPEADGRDLIDNVLTYLLYNEPPGTGSVSGRVTLVGSQDHSGVTIRIGMDHSTVTAADGSYHLTGLWGGNYRITAEIEGFAPQTRSVVVMDDVETTNFDFYMEPVIEVHYSATPGLPIPDNDPTGISHVIDVTESGNLHDLSIDVNISHFAVGQLVITLTSPEGTSVTLHNRTGGTADDLVGNWPESMFVDGPGELADFQDENPQGAWTLTVADEQFGALGVFNSWGLNLLVTDGSISAAPSGVPSRTRLVGNAPNPFNPRTVISFELAQTGPVRLEVYDVKGRLVQTLGDRVFEAGLHSVPWDGRDRRGGETASGLYFFRLMTEDEVQTHKMLLVR